MQTPVFTLFYEDKNITKDVSPYVLSVEYTDFEHGESDEVQIGQNAWIPSKGDSIRLYLGYENEKLLNCGKFEIDEIEFGAPPDTLIIKSLATGIKESFRQLNSSSVENQTLKQIALEYAEKHSLSLVGDIDNIKIDRITQNKETDLRFLTRISEQYGYIFKIAEDSLVFYKVSALKSAKSTLILYKSDLSRINLSEKTSKQYKAVQVSYFDPKKKKTIKTSVRNDNVQKGDTLKITSRCTNKKQAIIQANAALNRSNDKISGYVELYGNPNLAAGLNIELKDLGHFSGKYHITQAKHLLERSSGYRTSIEIESV